MKNKILIAVFFLTLFLSFWWTKQSLFYVPKNFPTPTYNFSKNPITEEKVLLGRALFHDPILSRDNTVSCTTCHSQYTAFTHTDHDLSLDVTGKIVLSSTIKKAAR